MDVREVGRRVRNMFTAGEWFTLGVGVAGLVFITPACVKEGFPALGVIVMGGSCVVILYRLVGMRASRLIKGLTIVVFGAFLPVGSKVLFNKVGLDSLGKNMLEMMCAFFNLAAAGAGGSILAAHADTFSRDNAAVVAASSATADTQRIKQLEHASRRQTYWIKILCVLVAVLIAVATLNLIY